MAQPVSSSPITSSAYKHLEDLKTTLERTEGSVYFRVEGKGQDAHVTAVTSGKWSKFWAYLGVAFGRESYKLENVMDVLKSQLSEATQNLNRDQVTVVEGTCVRLQNLFIKALKGKDLGNTRLENMDSRISSIKRVIAGVAKKREQLQKGQVIQLDHERQEIPSSEVFQKHKAIFGEMASLVPKEVTQGIRNWTKEADDQGKISQIIKPVTDMIDNLSGLLDGIRRNQKYGIPQKGTLAHGSFEKVCNTLRWRNQEFLTKGPTTPEKMKNWISSFNICGNFLHEARAFLRANAAMKASPNQLFRAKSAVLLLELRSFIRKAELYLDKVQPGNEQLRGSIAKDLEKMWERIDPKGAFLDKQEYAFSPEALDDADPQLIEDWMKDLNTILKPLEDVWTDKIEGEFSSNPLKLLQFELELHLLRFNLENMPRAKEGSLLSNVQRKVQDNLRELEESFLATKDVDQEFLNKAQILLRRGHALLLENAESQKLVFQMKVHEMAVLAKVYLQEKGRESPELETFLKEPIENLKPQDFEDLQKLLTSLKMKWPKERTFIRELTPS